MSLCSLCSTIPFASLSPCRENRVIRRIRDHTDLPELCEVGEKSARELIESIGFPWHANIGTLEAAAQIEPNPCSLCSIAWAGYLIWLENFEHAGQSRFYQEFKDTRNEMPPTSERLYLTARLSGAPGFIVWTQNPLKPSYMRLLTGVAFSSDVDTHPAAKVLAGSPRLLPTPDIDSGSAHSLSIASSFLAECCEKHEKCLQQDALLPTRVLDTGFYGDSVKVVQPVGKSSKYACLSYCWGDSVPFTLTHDTMSDRLSEIRICDLPKTFVDAVVVVRRLGIRYLWIDSLCIIQDDADDWARESARMADVYSQAHVVIAANWARNVSQGCFHVRASRSARWVELPGEAQRIHAQLLFPSDELDFTVRSFPDEPLSQRSWALQERVLARRILHYNTRQIYYECNQGVLGDDGSFQATRPSSIAPPLEEGDHDPSPKRRRTMLEFWYNIVWQYGERKLTHETDKLPAMSGLARMFGEKFSAHYVAGVWSDDIIHGVTWTALGHAENPPSVYIGPSWSWACYSGITASSSKRLAHVAQVVDWDTTLKNAANSYGEVLHARIRIRAPMVRLLPAKYMVPGSTSRRQRAGLTPQPPARTSYHANEDRDFNIEYDFGQYTMVDIAEQHIIIMAGGETMHDSPDDDAVTTAECEFYTCLIVTSSGDLGQMKRLGSTSISRDVGMKIGKDEANWTTVALV